MIMQDSTVRIIKNCIEELVDNHVRPRGSNREPDKEIFLRSEEHGMVVSGESRLLRDPVIEGLQQCWGADLDD